MIRATGSITRLYESRDLGGALLRLACEASVDGHARHYPVTKNNLTAVTGVMTGTFTQPMPDGKGGTIAPTGKAFALDMITVGIWNRQGTMDEEFLFWDGQAFYQKIGLA